MKRLIALLLCAAFIFAFAACGGGSTETSGSAPEPAENSAPAESAESAEPGESSNAQEDTTSGEEFDESEFYLSWSAAFADMCWTDDDVPKGYAKPGEVSYLYFNSEGKIEIENVPFEEVRAFSAAGKGVPRTHDFDDMFIDAYKEYVLPALDYGMVHGSIDFCFAVETESVFLDLGKKDYFYNIFKVFAYDNRCSLDYLIEKGNKEHKFVYWRFNRTSFNTQWKQDFKKAVDRANSIVGELESRRMNDYQKALWLYRYVTENVKYYSGDYYGDNKYNQYNFLYDALINNSAVCTGYAAAINYLFNMAGIDCMVVAAGNGTIGHAWNVAKLGEKYYYFDATNDRGKEISDYLLFGISSEKYFSFNWQEYNDFMHEAHNSLGEDLPICDSELSEVWNKDDSGIVW